MSVDKFGYSGSGSARERGLTATENKFTADKFITLSRNLATKVSQSGDTMNGNLDILLNADTIRQFGVTDITMGEQVLFLLQLILFL